ncbi:MAG: lysylphosphatidylglycerol synthase domain-containing protein [Oligoflexia bacterium]
MSSIIKRTAPLLTPRTVPLLGSFVILGALYFLFSQSGQFELTEILNTFQRVGSIALTAGLFCVIAQVLAQGTRLWVLLPREGKLGWTRTLRIFSFGQVINSTFPARIGDVVKVGLLGSTSGAGSVFIADKIADVAALALVGGLAFLGGLADEIQSLGTSTPSAPFSAPQAAVAIVLLGATGAAVRWLWPLLPESFRLQARSKMAEVFSGLRTGASGLAVPSQLLPALFMGILAWAAELALLVLLCRAAGYSLSLGSGLASLLALNLGIAVPISVANIGTFEAALSFALTRFGISGPDALAIAALHHAIQLLGVAGVALAFNMTLKKKKSEFQVKPDDKFRAIAHYESLSQNYNSAVAKGPLKFLRLREQKAVFDLARLEDPSARTMIDVGCGGGLYALAAKKAGKHVTATDLSPGMIDRLKGKVDAAHVSDVESFSPGRTYDIVVCAGVLDFVLDPEAAFSNLCNLVARDRGRLVVLAPRQGVGGWIYRVEKKFVKVHVNLFDEAWFRKHAQAHGLKLVSTRRPLPSNQVLLFEMACPTGVEPVTFSSGG